MSYLVLARRWRPQRFNDVVGQEHVVRTLANAINSNRLAHAYLFTGVRGVGKTSIARIFAKSLNCEHGPTPEPCNECVHCREITAGSSVDVLEIDGASNTGVDDVRELREKVKYLPQSSKYKVYIIDEVHMLSIAAFNALLKTLEEPPSHVIFIFATTEAHKIPTTILSRCQRFDLMRIPRGELIEALEDICAKEEFSIDRSDLSLVAREAEGSMRDALSLLDQVVSFSGKEVPKGEVARALGIVDRTWISELVTAMLRSEPGKALDVIDRAFNHGYNLRELLKDVIRYVRHLAVAKEVDDPRDLIDLADDEIEAIKSLAEQTGPEKLQGAFAILSRADENMAHVQDPRSILEMAVLKVSHVAPAMPVDEAIARLEQLERRLSSGTPARPAPAPGSSGGSTSGGGSASRSVKKPEPSPPPEDSPSQGRLFSWEALVKSIREEGNPLLEVLIESARFEKMDDNVLIISAAENSTELAQLKRKGVRETIERLGGRIHGQKIRLKVVESRNGEKPKLKEVETGLERSLKDEAREHPLVKGAREILDATIVDIRPKVRIQPDESSD